MGKASDSDDDIWNYKSSLSKSKSGRGKGRNTPIVKQVPKTSKVKGQDKKGESTGQSSIHVGKCGEPTQPEVIDVDLDFVDQIEVPKKRAAGLQNQKIAASQKKSKTPKSDSKSTKSSKLSLKSVSKKLSSSPNTGKNSSPSKSHADIQTYFKSSQNSPRRPLKRKSSESVEIFVCSSSEENEEMSNEGTSTPGEKPSKIAHLGSNKKGEPAQNRKDVSCHIGESSEAGNSNCEKKDMMNHEETKPVKVVDVIIDSGSEEDSEEFTQVVGNQRSEPSCDAAIDEVKDSRNDSDEDLFSDSEKDFGLKDFAKEGTSETNVKFSHDKQNYTTSSVPSRLDELNESNSDQCVVSSDVNIIDVINYEDSKDSTYSSSASTNLGYKPMVQSLSSVRSIDQSEDGGKLQGNGLAQGFEQFSSVVSAPRKQASLFSFFKPKFTSSVSTKSEGGNSKGGENRGSKTGNTFLNVNPRPDLRRGKTFPRGGATGRGSVGSSDAGLKKTSSDVSEFKPDNSTETKGKGFRGRKQQCPFYKKIPGTAITVDAFRYGVIPDCSAYVLTHFHYDHYGGLTKKFAQPIYCSPITGNLVESRLGVDAKWINRIPMWQPCQVAGITVTLMEANHCPGAVIILFELKNGSKILHTGDFRANPEMEQYQMLKGTVISELYLDTTYCNPSYAFPPQKDVIDFVVSLVAKHMEAHPQMLIVCGAYTIGKERIFTAIAKVLDSKICVMNDKKKVLDCLDDPDLSSRVTLDWSKGQVHVLPMGKLNQKCLFDHLARHHKFKSILAFQPTGWTHTDKTIALKDLRPKWSFNGVTLYGVPYSEHSSFLELKRFVQFTRPRKILPTVNNGNPSSREKMEAIFKQWMSEKSGDDSGSHSSSQQSNLTSWVT